MVFDTIENVNITGLDEIIVYVATAVPIFIPAVIVAVWIMFSCSIYFGTRRFSGQADPFTSFAIGGFMAAIIATIFTFTTGFIDKYTISSVLVILIICFILLMAKRSRD